MIHNPLLTIPVPLKRKEADVMLDLSGFFTTVCECAGYDYKLPYDSEPKLPLIAEDVQWAKEILAKVR